MATAIEQIPLPEQEIEQIFQLHDVLSINDLNALFESVTSQISHWLEAVHLTVFTLEQSTKQQILDDNHEQTSIALDNAMIRMDPIILCLADLTDIIYNANQGNCPQYQLKTTKIQSEWSSLSHFLASVKKTVMETREKQALTQAVERLWVQMDDVSLMIFEFQEKKQTTMSWPPLTDSDSSTTSGDLTVDSQQTWLHQNGKDDQTMVEIDAAYDSLLNVMEHVYSQYTSNPPQDPVLVRRLEKVKEKWELLQHERDELKYEHKEDRWLTVFRRVADQVDVMIDGLDRSVVQCYALIQQTRDWHASMLPATPTSTFDKFSKTILRSFHPTNTPVDKEKFRAVEKSFEAKYKYYTPSIDRMLAMLGNGIAARASRDNVTSQRHEAMLQRWHHLKEVMDELRMRDLAETERIILSGTTSTTSSTSDSSRGWRGIRYRTPEPSSPHINERVRSVTPNSRMGRSSPRFHHNKSPQTEYYQPPHYPQSHLRGSISDSSSVGSSPPRNSSRNSIRQTKTPRPTRNGSTTSSNLQSPKHRAGEDFYEEDERYYGVDIMKTFTRGGTRRSEQQHIQQQNGRSKTPNPPTNPARRAMGGARSKSSMGDIHSQRAMSPSYNRRSVTPSLIPRPKTPKEETQIPRPRSQMTKHYQKPPPPVPPIPKYVVKSHESDYAAYRDPTLIRKKKSMSSLKQQPLPEDDHHYHADPKDSLDVEVAQIVNASPIAIQCQRAQPGRYYFGSELSMSSMGGKKMYACKLMTYNDRRGGQFKNNKVLIRVGGGWQDLEFFLLEHSSLMASDMVRPSTYANSGGGSWKN
jgi:hypothetical protein